MKIQLHDRIACYLARIFHVDQGFSAPIRPNLSRVEPQVTVGEGRIAQPISKRIERKARKIPVARCEPRDIFRLMGQIMVIVEWFLTCGARPAERQLSSWIDIAEKNIGNGITTL